MNYIFSSSLILNQIYPKNKILCESHKDKRKLYPALSKRNTNNFLDSIMDFLQYADGKNNINEILVLIKRNLKFTINISNLLLDKKLIEF